MNFRAYLVAGLLAVSSLASAATSDSVTLGGHVDSTLFVEASATAGATDLDLSSGQKIVKVADIAMGTNNDQGLRLTASSGALTKSGGADINFQVVTVDDTATPPIAAAFLVASGDDYTWDSDAAAGNFAQDLYIMYSPGATQDPGDYSGVIDLTVEDL
jgi:hypothetical protein